MSTQKQFSCPSVSSTTVHFSIQTLILEVAFNGLGIRILIIIFYFSFIVSYYLLKAIHVFVTFYNYYFKDRRIINDNHHDITPYLPAKAAIEAAKNDTAPRI